MSLRRACAFSFRAIDGLRPEIIAENRHSRPEGGAWAHDGTHFYVLGPNPDERLIYIDHQNNVFYPHTDKRGSTIALSQAGAVTARYTYGPFGEGGQGPTGYPFRYTGQRLDPWTGLYDYKARVYSPALGRFLQPDPALWVDGPNLYAYVGNGPTNAVDPTGNYGRGTGWEGRDAEWNKFDAAQRQTAEKFESAATQLRAAIGQMEAAAQAGQDASRAMPREVAEAFGRNASVSDLQSAVNSLTGAAAALRSDGSDGYVANALGSSAFIASAQGMTNENAAYVAGRGPIMTVNLGHAAFTRGAGAEARDLMRGIVGHEAFHSANLGHERGSNGAIGYRYAEAGSPQERAYQSLRGTPAATRNPDNLGAFAGL